MTLLNPTDRELDAAFAEHVAGIIGAIHVTGRGLVYPIKSDGVMEERRVPLFTQSADAVLPWLQGWYCSAHWFCGAEGARAGWRVDIESNPIDKTPSVSATSKTLPRAAVLALLRAHGIEIQFTPTPK